MATGRPVISFGVGGVGEYLVAAQTLATCAADPRAVGCGSDPNEAPANGIAVDSPDPAALAEAIILALDDPAARRALGANARAAVLDRFRVADQLRKYDVLYTRLLARAPLDDLPWVLST